MSSRTLDDAAIETLLRTTTETLGAHFATDQTMRGDRIGLSVAATVSSEEAAVRASDRIGEPLSAEQGKSLGSLPILRLDRTFGSATSTGQSGGAGAGASSSPSVATADLSNDFQPVRVLGEGGMGQVILARQSTLDREVAVKRTKAEAKARAEEVASKAKSGGDFTELVKTYSDDPAAKERMGSVGKFTRDKMVKPFSDAAFALEVDATSGVVETPFGFHVIKRNQ